MPGASAVLYTFDARGGAFDPVSRSRPASGGRHPRGARGIEDDEPRVTGLGMRAVGRLGPVLSYEEPSLDIHPAKLAAGAKVLACLPLVVAGAPAGVLYVYLREFAALPNSNCCC